MIAKAASFLFFVLFGIGLTAYHSFPYVNEDKVLPFAESDFFVNQKPLAKLIQSKNIKNAVEVGAWFGKSTIFIANLLPPEGVVYAVDSWIGYPKEQYKITKNVYQQFLSNIIHSKLTESICPLRMTSISASKVFKNYCDFIDLIYIDGDHSYYSVYSDLAAWKPHLSPNGVICGNLYSKFNESQTIKKAVEDFCKDNKLNVIYEEDLWIIQ